MSDKKKYRRRMSPLAFIGCWAGTSYLVWTVWVMTALFIHNRAPQNLAYGLPLEVSAFLSIGFISLVTGAAQHRLLQTQMRPAVQGWWWKSALAWVIIGTLWIVTIRFFDIQIDFLPSNTVAENALYILLLGGLFVPTAVVQTWILRNHLKYTWLWVLGAVVSVVILPVHMLLLINDSQNHALLFLIAMMIGLVHGSVTGIVMMLAINLTRRSDAVLETPIG